MRLRYNLQLSFLVFFPTSKNSSPPNNNASLDKSSAMKGGAIRNNGFNSNGNIINTQDLAYQSRPDKNVIKYSNNGGHYKNSSANSRQQYGQYTTDSNGRYKNSNGNQSAYHLQKSNHSNSGSGSKHNSNISNSSSGVPVHPGLGNKLKQ